jgi:hypothetical protein
MVQVTCIISHGAELKSLGSQSFLTKIPILWAQTRDTHATVRLTSGGSDKAGEYILGGLTSEVRPLCLSPSLSEPLMRLLCLPRPPAQTRQASIIILSIYSEV